MLVRVNKVSVTQSLPCGLLGGKRNRSLSLSVNEPLVQMLVMRQCLCGQFVYCCDEALFFFFFSTWRIT